MSQRLVAVVAAALTSTGAALYGTPSLANKMVQDKPWHLAFLKVAEAQRISTGKDVTVAVVDSGVSNHPSLAGNLLEGTDFVKPSGDGRTDRSGHGTAMAGLIAAHGQNKYSVLGIAPDAEILPVRIFDRKPQENAQIGPAIQYAVSRGAKVINLSIGGGVDSATLSAVKSAVQADVILIASAGNKPLDVGITAPAFIDGVLAVGAVDSLGKKAEISVSGAALDLMAPGEDIESLDREGGYRSDTGTSDSAAIVSGAAALIRSRFPSMSAVEVVQRLESTAVDKGAPGVDPDYGHGIIDIVAALKGGGSSGASAPSGPSATTAAPATTSPAPQAGAEPASNNAPLVAGGVALVVLLGGFVGFLLLRRRSRPPA